MCRHRQPCLSINVLLAQILVPSITRVHNLDVHALLLAHADVGSDDDELVRVRGVPDAFCGRSFGGGEGELDGVRGGGCKGEEEEDQGQEEEVGLY